MSRRSVLALAVLAVAALGAVAFLATRPPVHVRRHRNSAESTISHQRWA